MTDSSTATGATPAPAGLLSRFVGVITAPRETFQRIVAHPRWVGMLILTTVIIAVCAALPMTTEAGKQAALEQQIEQMEAFGMEVNEEMYTAMQRRMRIAPYTTVGFVLLFTPLITLAITGILFVVFNAVLGGDATFKQLFSVVVHASVISALAQLFTGPLNYFRGTVASATNLGVLLPMIDETSFVGKLLRTIDVFLIWWVIVLSIGLAVLYRRRTQPIAITLFAIYGAIAVAIAAIMTRLGGS